MEKTIGQEVEKRVKEAIETYEYFKRDKDKTLSIKAEQLAKHDIIVQYVVARMSKERIEKYFATKTGDSE